MAIPLHHVPYIEADLFGQSDAVGPVARRVERRLEEILRSERGRWLAERDELAGLFGALEEAVLGGGKRLRPAFCYWGFVGAGGDPGREAVIDAGAALELLHAFALVHDDVMDGSELRRGRPAMYRRLRRDHQRAGWTGDGRRYGTGVAVLVGDLAFAYAGACTANLPAESRWLWHELCLELTMGQYVDMQGAALADHDTARASWVAAYKSGRYTVERPLHLGASLVGLNEGLSAGYSAFGSPLGEAFQLRDDVLGVFGDEAVTGKPVGADLREGKPTLLLAFAAERSGAAGAPILARVGAPDMNEVDETRVRRLFVDSGALAAVERAIDIRVQRALRALHEVDVTPAARDALAQLAAAAAWRDC
ncbi:MAG: polyprenyl synthetase family protein [Acidimicrobiia bacterium]|nr:polyprenyl synthetase family protein [Acidimicrobiia bacterium]